MSEQVDAAWGIHSYMQKEYYKMYEARNALYLLLRSLEYSCRGLEDSQKICREALGVCRELFEPINKLSEILAPFGNLGFRDKYEELK